MESSTSKRRYSGTSNAYYSYGSAEGTPSSAKDIGIRNRLSEGLDTFASFSGSAGTSSSAHSDSLRITPISQRLWKRKSSAPSVTKTTLSVLYSSSEDEDIESDADFMEQGTPTTRPKARTDRDEDTGSPCIVKKRSEQVEPSSASLEGSVAVALGSGKVEEKDDGVRVRKKVSGIAMALHSSTPAPRSTAASAKTSFGSIDLSWINYRDKNNVIIRRRFLSVLASMLKSYREYYMVSGHQIDDVGESGGTGGSVLDEEAASEVAATVKDVDLKSAAVVTVAASAAESTVASTRALDEKSDTGREYGQSFESLLSDMSDEER